MKTSILEFYVRPNAARTKIEGLYGDKIKIRLASPPEKGKANRELVSIITKLTGVPRNKISIISGITSNYKRVSIEGNSLMDYSEILLNNS